jgi:hypothetical protein
MSIAQLDCATVGVSIGIRPAGSCGQLSGNMEF